jgi:hypothetical protein
MRCLQKRHGDDWVRVVSVEGFPDPASAREFKQKINIQQAKTNVGIIRVLAIL